jgi:PAS domain S-box-containing protein
LLSDDEPTTWRRLRAATGRTEIATRADETGARSVMLDAVGVGLAEVRSNGAFVRANARLYAMLGYARDALPTLTLQSILLPTDPPLRVHDLAVSCLESSRPPVCRRLRRGDGEVIWVELMASPADPSHVNGNCLLTLVDVTRFKAAEVRLAESELRQAELEFSRESNL